MDKSTNVLTMAQASKRAASEMAKATTEQKNAVLLDLIENIGKNQEAILEANGKDIAIAKENGLAPSLIERLSLENRLEEILHDIEQVRLLPDPVGEVLDAKILPNELHLTKYSTPIGVLGVIYESRPNVTLDISALTIKSGNCALLRGGSETMHTNQILISLIQKSLVSNDLPAEAIQLIVDSYRARIKEMLQLYEYIDLIIPRGGSALQSFCREHSKIPVIIGGIGICHLFVDETADLEKALLVVHNAKVQRPTVCNALDTVLIHSSIASSLIPRIIETLASDGVTFRLDERAYENNIDHFCSLAGPTDWDTEWLSLVLGIKIVENIKEAIGHIQKHSTGHSDGILTKNLENAEIFIKSVDSAAVYVNASTRFTDGGQFGLGSEVAISTQKLHARGPMGLKELTTYKWIIRGDYHVRE